MKKFQGVEFVWRVDLGCEQNLHSDVKTMRKSNMKQLEIEFFNFINNNIFQFFVAAANYTLLGL